MKRKLAALFLTFTMVAGITACGSTAESTSTASTESTPVSSTEEKTETTVEESVASNGEYDVTEPITIEFWCPYAEEKKYTWWQDCVDRFNESQDMVTVNMVQISGYPETDSQLTAAQAAGTGIPAVLFINYPRVLTYANSGMLEPLDNYIEATDFDVDDFYAGLRDPLSLDNDGLQYGLPVGASGACYYYNEDLLNELNLEVPTTWEELKEFSKQFYEATGKPGFGLMSELNYVEVAMRTTACDPLGDGEKNDMMNEKLLQWLSEYKEMVNAGYMSFYNSTDYSSDTLNDFYNKNVAIICHTSSIAAQLKDNAGFNVGAFAQLQGEAETLSTAAGAAIIIPEQNDQQVKNAAWVFTQYILDDENMTDWSIVGSVYPARKSILEDETRLSDLYEQYPLCRDIYAGMDNIVSKNKSPYQTACYKVLLEAMGRIIYDDADLNSTWQDAANEIDQLLSGN